MPTISLIGLIIMAVSMLILSFVSSFCVYDGVFLFGLSVTGLIIGFVMCIGGNFIPEPLDKQYEQKVNAITEAEKELQKFLIDHPEFKEEINER